MSENERRDQEERPDGETTSPPDDTHEATTPPGSGELDEESLERGKDELDQAGGGH